MTVFYLYVREKFQWTIRDFTMYETVYQIKSMFGAIIGFLLLRKVSLYSITRPITIKLTYFSSIYLFLLEYFLCNSMNSMERCQGFPFVGGDIGDIGILGRHGT